MQTNVILYCKLCKYLSPKEHEQTSKKEKHICKKYSKQVKHLGHHPELPRLPECDEPMHRYEAGATTRHLTPLAPDSLKAGDSSLPDPVKVVNDSPAESG